MSRRMVSLLVAVLGLVALGSGGPPPAVNPTTDRAKAAVLPGWGTAIDPDQDCQVEISADNADLSITVPATAHDFAAELQRYNAPRVIRKVKGDFIAEVHVGGSFNPQGSSTIDGRKPYNGAGLIVIDDPQNTVSLQRGAFMDQDHVRHYLNFEVRQGGKVAVSDFGMDIKDAPCWLRLERRGGKFYAQVSEDDVNWKSYPPAEAGFPEKLQLGVEAINSNDAPFHCTFDHFAVFQATKMQTAASK